MSKKLKKGVMIFDGDKPMQVLDNATEDVIRPTDDQQQTINVVGKVVREYRNAAEKLLKQKYSHLKEFVPEYLVEPGNIMVACCNDGIVVRYEKKTETPKVFTMWMSENLSQVSSLLSQNLIQCHSNRHYKSTVETTGTEIKLFAANPATNHVKDIISFRIGLDVILDQSEQISTPGTKPFCLASVRNTFELGLECMQITNEEKPDEGRRFLTRSKLRLPVGWECIEIYPFLDINAWQLEHAPAWAEKDILASVVANQIKESHYQSLDPNAGARKHYCALLSDFKTLLDSKPEREEILQDFLKNNPFLLCPTHTKMWPKLKLGAKITDFIFRDAISGYLLVELEKSTHTLFRVDGHTRNELNVALGQIIDWKRYIEDNLHTVQHELGLTNISSNPNSLIVIGRSDTLSPENLRTLNTIENAQPKLKVMTYDDVYDNAKAVIENLLGGIWDPGGETQIYYLT